MPGLHYCFTQCYRDLSDNYEERQMPKKPRPKPKLN